jgi:hypothetical protein
MQALPFAILLTCAVPQAAEMPVRVQVGPGPVFVNQPVPLRVSVVTDGDRPVIAPPRFNGARLLFVESSVRPVSTSAIGDVVTETNQYRADYLLVPSRSGTLNVPPFVVRQAERARSTKAASVAVKPWPPDRPAAFLGGVGPVRVEIRAEPAAIRLGEAFEYQIRLIGPGAIGSEQPPPALARLRDLPIRPTVEPLPPDVSPADPPSRVIRFRVRPSRAGQATLPAVPVAWLNPKSGRYQTVIGSALPIRVEDVPNFDPAGLAYEAARPEARSRSWLWLGAAVAGLLAGLSPLLRWFVARLRRRARRPEAIAWSWSRSLSRPGHSSEQTARLLQAGLTEYLKAAEGRPEGVLTPSEAQQAIGRVTGRGDLGDLAAELVSDSDRAWFADGQTRDEHELGPRACRFFTALAAVQAAAAAGANPCAGRPASRHA